MKTVRGKFQIDKIEQLVGNRKHKNGDYEKVEYHTIHFSPVMPINEEDENAKMWDETPSGRIELSVLAPEAWEQFTAGKIYNVDFSEFVEEKEIPIAEQDKSKPKLKVGESVNGDGSK